MTSPNLLLDVEALTSNKAAFDISHYGIIRMIGNEGIDFLQRISTNDFSNFSTRDNQTTILLNEKGRIIDRITVLKNNDSLLIITSSNAVSTVITWLNKFIIMEDLILEDISGTIPIWMTFDNTISTIVLNQDKEYFMQNQYRIIAKESLKYFRIYHGIPAFQKELTELYNPLELNLWNDVSFTKGCYIGQEVIARLDTYQKIQRKLCRFQTILLLDSQTQFTLTDGNEVVGKITSSCVDIYSSNTSIGLAVIKSKHAIVNSELIIKELSEKIIITNVFETITKI